MNHDSSSWEALRRAHRELKKQEAREQTARYRESQQQAREAKLRAKLEQAEQIRFAETMKIQQTEMECILGIHRAGDTCANCGLR